MPTAGWASLRCVNGDRDVGIARSARAREELAKAWLLDVLERTPLAEIGEVPIEWIAREGPALINDILRGVGGPAPASELELPADGIERIGGLGRLRSGESALQIPRDLAALQALLIEALRREVPERQLGAFAGSVERLAEIFGDIQAQVGERLVRERSGGARADPLTGLPGQAELHEWLRVELAEYRRSGRPFTVLIIDVDGLNRVNDAYGSDSGERMLSAISAVVRRQVRDVDRAFRLDRDELCVLAPDQRAHEVLPLAERLCDLVDRSQSADGPRVAISGGIASCPEHGESADDLLAAAEQATWSAKASGRPVSIGAT
jgi:diguanylate cyclase (GGDEF)-like protein